MVYLLFDVITSVIYIVIELNIFIYFIYINNNYGFKNIIDIYHLNIFLNKLTLNKRK